MLECPLCGRTLLLGERAARYRAGTRQLLVCELCVDDADSRGWLREGAPVPPPITVPLTRGSRRLSRLLGHRGKVGEKDEEEAPVVDEIAAPGENGLGQAAREGVSAFNRSPYRRAIAGISKSLGDPLVSVIPLAGTRPDVVVTVAWDITGTSTASTCRRAARCGSRGAGTIRTTSRTSGASGTRTRRATGA